MEKKFCQVCEKKKDCVVICRELEQHLKKDVEGSQRDLPIGLVFDSAKEMPMPIKSKIRLPRNEAEIISLLLQGIGVNDILERLHITKRAYYVAMHKVRRALRKIDEENNSSSEENQG